MRMTGAGYFLSRAGLAHSLSSFAVPLQVSPVHEDCSCAVHVSFPGMHAVSYYIMSGWVQVLFKSPDGASPLSGDVPASASDSARLLRKASTSPLFLSPLRHSSRASEPESRIINSSQRCTLFPKHPMYRRNIYKDACQL